MFFEYVLEEPDQKRIALRVLNMIFKKSSYTYSFWAFFMDPDPDFRFSLSGLRKNKSILVPDKRTRIRNTAVSTQTLRMIYINFCNFCFGPKWPKKYNKKNHSFLTENCAQATNTLTLAKKSKYQYQQVLTYILFFYIIYEGFGAKSKNIGSAGKGMCWGL